MLNLDDGLRPGELMPARLTGTTTVDLDLDLLVHLPTTRPPTDGHPVILYLHGRGERGSLDDVASFGPPMLARTQTDFPWAVLAPRCPPERGWETWDLLALLDAVLARLPLDADRVVVTGNSMGGYGAWTLLLAHPDRFAAVVPICGGAPGAVTSLIGPERLELIRSVPVRAFHGAQDEVVLPYESEEIVSELRALGCDAELTIYPGVGHDAWTRTYADPDLWTWLAAQRRRPRVQ